jgi:ABC-type multidrug transport system ATPase subunit
MSVSLWAFSLVRESEMLVVLGRPGSGCTTLLKTIAGETHGLNTTGDAHINYQGNFHYLLSCMTLVPYYPCPVQAYHFPICTNTSVVR